jgi:hypothetical protein
VAGLGLGLGLGLDKNDVPSATEEMTRRVQVSCSLACSVVNVASRTIRAVDELTRPLSLARTVARSEGYTRAARVWALSIVQGPSSVAPLTALFLFCVCTPWCRRRW